jgi:cytochrome o ubiquinol oxidase subunit 2
MIKLEGQVEPESIDGVNKKSFSPGWLILIIAMGLTDLGLILRGFLHGHNVALFNPRGLIAKQEHSLMLFAVIVLLAIGIPTLCLLYFTAWKYRETNTKARYDPSPKHGTALSVVLWTIPTLVMLAIATVIWPATFRLSPRKAIASSNKTLTIQVISMRWKWLFIYPEQQIATVNFVQVPVGTPVQFELTADDAPMSSFWIPNLSGQLYSMTGMVNRLNVVADDPGDYPGGSAEINGAGFSGMKFVARASDTQSFNSWVQTVKQSQQVLDSNTYASVLKPSQYNVAAFYSAYDNSLYDKVLTKYIGPGGHTH